MMTETDFPLQDDPLESAICIAGLMPSHGHPLIDTVEIVENSACRRLEHLGGYEAGSCRFEIIEHVARDAQEWLQAGDIVVRHRHLQLQHCDIIRQVRTVVFKSDSAKEWDEELAEKARENSLRNMEWSFNYSGSQFVISDVLGNVADCRLAPGYAKRLLVRLTRQLGPATGQSMFYGKDSTTAGWIAIEALHAAYMECEDAVPRDVFDRSSLIISEVNALHRNAVPFIEREGKVPICVYYRRNPRFWDRVRAEYHERKIWLPKVLCDIVEERAYKSVLKGARSLLFYPDDFHHLCRFVAWEEWNVGHRPFMVQDKRLKHEKPYSRHRKSRIKKGSV